MEDSSKFDRVRQYLADLYNASFVTEEQRIENEAIFKIAAATMLTKEEIQEKVKPLGLSYFDVYTFYCQLGRFPSEQQAMYIKQIGVYAFLQIMSRTKRFEPASITITPRPELKLMEPEELIRNYCQERRIKKPKYSKSVSITPPKNKK